MAWEPNMTPDTTMEASVLRYLHERRQLGFALKAPGVECHPELTPLMD